VIYLVNQQQLRVSRACAVCDCRGRRITSPYEQGTP